MNPTQEHAQAIHQFTLMLGHSPKGTRVEDLDDGGTLVVAYGTYRGSPVMVDADGIVYDEDGSTVAVADISAFVALQGDAYERPEATMQRVSEAVNRVRSKFTDKEG